MPVLHCIKDTIGWELHDGVANIVREKLTPHEFQGGTFLKNSFGSNRLAYNIKIEGYDYIEFIGLCTDICVISNAIIAKSYVPEAQIVVDSNCCAGSTPENHNAALNVMKACQIDILEEIK